MCFQVLKHRLIRAAGFGLAIFLTPAAPALSPEPAAVCEAVAVENPLVEGRAKSIIFPDGRAITVVGHMHGKRQIFELGHLIDSGQLAAMSDEEFNRLFLRISEENKKADDLGLTRQSRLKIVEKFKDRFGLDINGIVKPDEAFDLPPMSVLGHAENDLQFLSQAIKQGGSPAVQFVGYEGSQERWEGNFPYYLKYRQEILRQYNIRKTRGKIGFSQQELERLILSISNGNVYKYMINPKLNESIPMFGTEDTAAGEKYSDAEPLKRIKNALDALTKADDKYWAAKSEAALESAKTDQDLLIFAALLGHIKSEVTNMNIASIADLESMIGQLNPPPWLKAPLEELFNAFRDRLRLNFARDSASARNLAARHQSGIHFVGLNHFKNTLSNLQSLCKQELLTSGVPSIAPASLR